MPEPIPCLIRTLAPVHLGADEVYEPLGFVIDEKNSSLVAFEPGDFLARLSEPDRRRFLELCRRGTVDSILDIYRFYHEHRGLARGRAVAVCPGLVQHYREVINLKKRGQELQKVINQFTIHRTAYLPQDQRPYIPGSAVKGALRTAYLNALARIKSLRTPKTQKGRWDPRALEQQLLNYQRIDEDPFRLLKVSDFLPVGEIKTRIVYAVNEKKKASQFAPRGPYQILEVIEPGAEFLGTIALEEFPTALRRLAKIKHFFTLEELWQAARNFYPQEKQQEDAHLFELGLRAAPLPAADGQAPLRLGRHSGAECVTIAGHRHIKILQARGEPPKIQDHATTLWLAADFHQREKRREARLRPFGWVALGELDPAQAAALQKQDAARGRKDRGKPEPPPPPPPPEIPSLPEVPTIVSEKSGLRYQVSVSAS
uniref:CRISPR system Cms protein Csm5 n=1 Tax=Desulfobacca acetoxidans TaxID=60893 RepID=A0A7V4G8B6_9BACT